MKFEDLDVRIRTARLSANIYKELDSIKDSRELSTMLVGLIRSKQNT